MSPKNIPCLTAARIDCCCLANNHVLDWDYAGLDETLGTLDNAGIRHAGAGPGVVEASTPAVRDIPKKGRVLVFGLGSVSSGIPWEWRATEHQPGVRLLEEVVQTP